MFNANEAVMQAIRHGGNAVDTYLLMPEGVQSGYLSVEYEQDVWNPETGEIVAEAGQERIPLKWFGDYVCGANHACKWFDYKEDFDINDVLYDSWFCQHASNAMTKAYREIVHAVEKNTMLGWVLKHNGQLGTYKSYKQITFIADGIVFEFIMHPDYEVIRCKDNHGIGKKLNSELVGSILKMMRE